MKYKINIIKCGFLNKSKMNTSDLIASVSSFNQPAQEVPTPFFAVSVVKLVVLSFCTLGAYQIYWFYKNWKIIKEQEQVHMMPFWRAIFSIFFCYDLFEKIAKTAINVGLGNLPAASLSSAWIIFQLMLILYKPNFLLSIGNVFFLIHVQKTVNQINTIKVPGHNPNSQFSAWNILTVVVGGFIFLILLKAIFII